MGGGMGGAGWWFYAVTGCVKVGEVRGAGVFVERGHLGPVFRDGH